MTNRRSPASSAKRERSKPSTNHLPKVGRRLGIHPKKFLVEAPGEKGLRPVSESPPASECEVMPARSLLWETELGYRLRRELFLSGSVLVLTEDGVFIFDALDSAVQFSFDRVAKDHIAEGAANEQKAP